MSTMQTPISQNRVNSSLIVVWISDNLLSFLTIPSALLETHAYAHRHLSTKRVFSLTITIITNIYASITVT